MQNYIKTNILSLGQHFFFSCSGGGKCQEFKLRKLRKEEGGKVKRGIKFTFRSAVYVTLISRLFSDQAFILCCCNPSQLSYENTIFSVLLRRNVPSSLRLITRYISSIYKYRDLKRRFKINNRKLKNYLSFNLVFHQPPSH